MGCADFTSLDIDRSLPLQAQLYQQLVEWMLNGRLSPGSKLVSSRRIAAEIGVSRNTVILVLDQLKAEGFLNSAPGRGVFVCEQLPKVELASQDCRLSIDLPPVSNFARVLKDLPDPLHAASLPFTPGVPDLSAFPIKLWSSIFRRHQDRKVLMGFDGEQGYAPLREALADYLKLSRGVRCDSDQIIITSGAQQAISLCAQMTLNQGDTALVENPGYRRARQAFALHQSQLQAVPVSKNYLDVAALQRVSDKANLIYTTPTHQYPLGGIMPASERLRLLDWAAHTGTWILEDDYDSEFCYQQKPVAALQGMAPSTPVLYMGSFSKTLFPSLRVGYLVVPKALVGAFTLAKSYMSGEISTLTQAVIADFISEGHFVRHLRKMRLLYRDKWQHFCSLIDVELPDQARPIGESAGMHLVVETGGDDVTLQQQLRTKGFGSSPLSSYYLGVPERQGLVLGFANSSENQREQLMVLLKSLL